MSGGAGGEVNVSDQINVVIIPKPYRDPVLEAEGADHIDVKREGVRGILTCQRLLNLAFASRITKPGDGSIPVVNNLGESHLHLSSLSL